MRCRSANKISAAVAGVCCNKGIAKSDPEPLAFKGDEFAATDVQPALKD